MEVHKFGITGYKKQEQRIWEQERAIMLGAKVIVTCFVLSGHSDFIAQESGRKHCGGGGGLHYSLKIQDPPP